MIKVAILLSQGEITLGLKHGVEVLLAPRPDGTKGISGLTFHPDDLEGVNHYLLYLNYNSVTAVLQYEVEDTSGGKETVEHGEETG